MKHSQLKVFYCQKIQSQPINCSGDSYAFFMLIWDKRLINLQEQVYILYLNTGNEVIEWMCLNTGNSSETIFDIKLGLACALGCMASKIIIAHNHPSNILTPSSGDRYITKRLSQAAEIMDIKLSDHLIITDKGYYSFIDHGILIP